MLSDYLPTVKVPDITKGCVAVCVYCEKIPGYPPILLCNSVDVYSKKNKPTCEQARSNNGACGPEARFMTFRK